MANPKKTFDGARITFTVVPHGYEASGEVDVKVGREVITQPFMFCRDFGGTDGAKFFAHLFNIADRTIRPDEDTSLK